MKVFPDKYGNFIGKDNAGNIVYFPWGSVGGGYIIPAYSDYEGILKNNINRHKFNQLAALFICVTAFLISSLFFDKSLIASCIALITIGALFTLWGVRDKKQYLKQFQRSQEKFEIPFSHRVQLLVYLHTKKQLVFQLFSFLFILSLGFIFEFLNGIQLHIIGAVLILLNIFMLPILVCALFVKTDKSPKMTNDTEADPVVLVIPRGNSLPWDFSPQIVGTPRIIKIYNFLVAGFLLFAASVILIEYNQTKILDVPILVGTLFVFALLVLMRKLT